MAATHLTTLVWGVGGAEHAAAAGVGTAVVVDVLSFSTTVTVAADLGVEVLPHAWTSSAAAHALSHGATLARGRHQAGPGEVSLSPVSLRLASGLHRLVLPSPNGSTICAALDEEEVEVAVGCLRNATAAGRWLAAADVPGVVVAAGERWTDGGLRPALEDLLGAGAVLAAAADAGAVLDADARAAVAAYDEARSDLGDRVRACPSGVELSGTGFAADVEVALELDASPRVPVLDDGVFAAP
ncbi:2-phosphosulfolactate phosphatase [Nocardioides aurantiacus]|uniref:Probable 2-phosphosulfolactate phosphatase n=1 Tax=Nocardioides aurantiacus TaxID=86796 RepID=A0A3N2CQ85_9ACTN|nr:2-phosphosulfolactate phosphatase [Nocardioides aurantiacus]ROR89568.1 2-phosphosulfolactate phosphatase [Nocardioides aurantiacus]